jgi:hypothetical protein
LIKEMASNNRLWGAERIRGGLLKLGIRVCLPHDPEVSATGVPASLKRAKLENISAQSCGSDLGL